jgi:hypothetical protein
VILCVGLPLAECANFFHQPSELNFVTLIGSLKTSYYH